MHENRNASMELLRKCFNSTLLCVSNEVSVCIYVLISIIAIGLCFGRTKTQTDFSLFMHYEIVTFLTNSTSWQFVYRVKNSRC